VFRLMTWLLAEHGAGHDDRAATLLSMAGKFVALAQEHDASQTPLTPLSAVNKKLLSAIGDHVDATAMVEVL